MREIPLTRGYVALVDDDDYDALTAGGKWRADVRPHTVYVKRNAPRDRLGPVGRVEYLHRLLVPGADVVDHKNGNGLDNRRENLRAASPATNQHNYRRPPHNRSGFKGVGFRRHRGTWRARIKLGGEDRHLGVFGSADEAALAYDEAARRLHGEFAALNFPRPGEIQA